MESFWVEEHVGGTGKAVSLVRVCKLFGPSHTPCPMHFFLSYILLINE